MKVRVVEASNDGYEFITTFEVEGKRYSGSFFAKGHGDFEFDPPEPTGDVATALWICVVEGPGEVGTEREFTPAELQAKALELGIQV